MDQIKIGRFIAEERKKKGYTQKRLAEALGISDKTISKWETGNGFPEISLLLPLCEELEITVNELLSGERLSDSEYKKKAEENMVNLVREAQESKKKIVLAALVAFMAVLAAVTLILVSGLFVMGMAVRGVLIGVAILIIVIGITVACMLDRDAGAFECKECGHRFVPEMKSYVMATHTLTMRRLKCPKCGKRSYCKHVMTK